MKRIARTLTAIAATAAAGAASLLLAGTTWAATGFSATNISGGTQATALSTAHAVSANEHLICGGHPTNVTSAVFNGTSYVFHVNPALPVAGGKSITCIAG